MAVSFDDLVPQAPVNFDDLIPTQSTPGPTGNAMAGAARALEANLPFVDRAVAAAQTYLPSTYGGTGRDYTANLATERAKNAQFAEQNPATNIAGGFVASAPLALASGPTFGLGGLAGRTASSAVPFAAAGGVQGASNSPDLTNIPETAKEAAIGTATGATLGAAAPAVASGVAKAISPFHMDAARQALVAGLRKAGINPTAGQMTGNKTLSRLEATASDIPFGGGGSEAARIANNKAFTGALMDKAGLSGVTDASQDSLNAAHDALGRQFDALGERNSILPDPQLERDLDSALGEYHGVTPESMRAPGITKIVNDIRNPAGVAIDKELPFDAGAPPRPSGQAPVPMLDFLRRGGGLQDEGGDLKSMGFDNLKGVAAKGASKIIDKENGRPMDEGLRAAIEAGYMEPHETVSDFINKIGEHPTYSVHDEDAVAARAARDMSGYGPGREPAQPAESDMFPGDRLSAATGIPGDHYNNLRSQLGKTAQRLKITDPAQAEAYRGVQGALDDAMERSITARAARGDQQAAQDLGAFQDVRSKYKNLLAIEQAAGSAGADAALGQITPAQMRTALASGNNRRTYARGIGDLAPLTNAANAILTNFPQSGTPARLLAAHLLGAGVGGGVGYHEGGLTGALAGITAPAIGARALMSRPAQAVLANQLMRGPVVANATNRAALGAALAARPQLQRPENTAR